MQSTLDRFKKDLDALIARGNELHNALQAELYPEEFQKVLVRNHRTKAKAQAYRDKLPSFGDDYQGWYSEAGAVIKQLLPDRLADFVRHYEKPKGRKDITFENYKIEDCLQGLRVTRGGEKIVGPEAALPQLWQQRSILRAARARFDSSLFDIRQLVQADLFDSEIDAGRSLAAHGFTRAAGAVAGVVLEKHLGQVCANHNIGISKTHATIADLNDALKRADTIDTAQWRRIQHLADLRNLCDHNKKREPTPDEVEDLLDGVAKLSKTLF